MNNLQTALDLLAQEFGELDNIKLLLGGGEGMTSDTVAAELLDIARSIVAGELKSSTSYAEPKLASTTIAL